jgi:hypothetical protein
MQKTLEYVVKKKLVIISLLSGYILSSVIGFLMEEPLQKILGKLPLSKPYQVIEDYYHNLEIGNINDAINNWSTNHYQIDQIRKSENQKISQRNCSEFKAFKSPHK